MRRFFIAALAFAIVIATVLLVASAGGAAWGTPAMGETASDAAFVAALVSVVVWFFTDPDE